MAADSRVTRRGQRDRNISLLGQDVEFVNTKATGAYNYQMAINDVLFVCVFFRLLRFFSDWLKHSHSAMYFMGPNNIMKKLRIKVNVLRF